MAATAGFKHSPPSMSATESSDTGRGKWVYGGGATAENLRKANSIEHEDYAMRRVKEAEKAEKIMHLICWGPTK